MKHSSVSCLKNFCLTMCVLLFIAFAPGASTLTDANDAYNAGEAKKAIGLYRRALAEGESQSLCYFNIANGYFQLDSLAQAIVYYRACVRTAPDFFKAHLNIAVCYYTLNDLGRSLAALRRALQIDPRHQKSLLIQAAALRGCGATARAAAAFEHLSRLYPNLEEPYIALGEIYRELGDVDLAIRWLGSCPPGSKNVLYVNMLLSELYEQKNDLVHAIYFQSQAFDCDTTRQNVLFRIASLQLAGGNDLVALETCRSGLRRFPDFSDLAVLGGSIAFARGRIDDAEKLFNQGAKAGSPAAVVGLTNIRNHRKAQQRE